MTNKILLHIFKPGKMFKFRNAIYKTPCKIFINDEEKLIVTSMLKNVVGLGDNDFKFDTEEKVNKKEEKKVEEKVIKKEEKKVEEKSDDKNGSIKSAFEKLSEKLDEKDKNSTKEITTFKAVNETNDNDDKKKDKK